MSHAGAYIKTGMAFINKLEEGKPHTSVTDWIEVLSSDRYDELSLDGIPELVESVNIQGASGTQVCVFVLGMQSGRKRECELFRV